ncbi:hypothetical protein H0H87_012894, partial [Tephrocybe sp. NHM501043]
MKSSDVERLTISCRLTQNDEECAVATIDEPAPVTTRIAVKLDQAQMQVVRLGASVKDLGPIDPADIPLPEDHDEDIDRALCVPLPDHDDDDDFDMALLAPLPEVDEHNDDDKDTSPAAVEPAPVTVQLNPNALVFTPSPAPQA